MKQQRPSDQEIKEIRRVLANLPEDDSPLHQLTSVARSLKKYPLLRKALRLLLGRVKISSKGGGTLRLSQKHLDALRDIVDDNYVDRAVKGLEE